ncbi:MAG: LptA/OstA family protein [Litoreibacter sp.]
MRHVILAGLLAVLPVAAISQGANIAFGDTKIDPDAPVEITADELSVDQSNGSAIFAGNVVAGQGELRLSAGNVRVQYVIENGDPTSRIDKLYATGGVTLVNGPEAAEAREAVYSVDAGEIEMTGDVVLTQGQSALSGEKLIVDLNAGTGRIVGRVRTIFQTGNDN